MTLSDDRTWKRCSSCKEPIEFGVLYWVCNVSTCNRNRTALQFCTVSCWDEHLPIARHRESWAEERHAPATREAAERVAKPKEAPRPKRRIVADAKPARAAEPAAAKPAATGTTASNEVLIVASRLKDFVRYESGFNTSDRVLEPLSEIVRRVCRQAIANAERDGRKTILDRDIPKS